MPMKKASHMGLQRHKGEYMMTALFLFLGESSVNSTRVSQTHRRGYNHRQPQRQKKKIHNRPTLCSVI